MRPHVCLFTDSPEPSGMGEDMLTLGAHLRSRYRVTLVCGPHPHRQQVLARASRLGIDSVAIEVSKDGREVGAWLDGHAVDVFHDHAGIGWEGHPAIAAVRPRVPVVVRTEHQPFGLLGPDDREREERTVAMVDALIGVSHASARSFVAAGLPAHKVRVVHNGVAVRTSRPARIRDELALPASARLVLAVGRLREQKGHEELVSALPRVVEEAPDVHAVIVGEGPLHDDLLALARALGVERRIHLLGARRDVPALMAACDLLAFPSRWEGLPLVVLEAMLAGLPIVATAINGTTEVRCWHRPHVG